jgi:hypothetical protein
MIAADIVRSQPVAPNSMPKEAKEPATSPKVKARPLASTSGARASSAPRAGDDDGANGNTHGLKIVKIPARKASSSVAGPVKGSPARLS